jgi:hypothetical protein
MINKPTDRPNRLGRPHRRSNIYRVLTLAIVGLTPTAVNAYTAAGDRNFPATLTITTQVAPADALWGWISTQPFPSPTGQETLFVGSFAKMITEDLGIQFNQGTTRQNGANSTQNFNFFLQYEAFVDQSREFLFSVGVGHSFGAQTINSTGLSGGPSTTPAITFAKGLGDLPIGYWRPLAITGFAGYQATQGNRPSFFETGFSVQYSIPYLVSKVANVNLPTFLRGMTPMTEVFFTTPTGQVPAGGLNTTLLVAPGISYTRGRGWEFGIEALIPTTRATASGVGVIAQLVIQLDYLFPESIGRPIFLPNDPR